MFHSDAAIPSARMDDSGKYHDRRVARTVWRGVRFGGPGGCPAGVEGAGPPGGCGGRSPRSENFRYFY